MACSSRRPPRCAGGPIEKCARRIRPFVNGVAVADTTHAVYLFESGHLPVHHVPRVDVDWDHLRPSDTTTRCPRKGEASYWSVVVGDRTVSDAMWAYPSCKGVAHCWSVDAGGRTFEDIAWIYEPPIPECPKNDGLLCFYDEKVEAVLVDGIRQERPITPWS